MINSYIELDRRFAKRDLSRDLEVAAEESYALQQWSDNLNAIGWEDLFLKSTLVILLGEPGCGKTFEMREQTVRNQEKGRPTYFLPLESLVEGNFAHALGENYQNYERWKAQNNSSTAWFMLDSVDESKLRRIQNFEKALTTVRIALGSNLQRAKFIISSRISDWTPDSDRRRVIDALGINQQDNLFIVQMLPLNKEQVKNYIISKGINDYIKFISDLDDAHAWEFARRPLDVNLLTEYWRTYKRIGSPSETIQYMVEKQLEERQERRISNNLSKEKALSGAQALAAASILCRTVSFQIPDEESLSGGVGALKSQDCLPPDWTQNECASLLSRALFDCASYGRIRFHHRRIADFLSAQWLGNLMERECPVPILEEILFSKINGQRQLRPSFASVAAWLACLYHFPWTEQLREWLLSTVPEIFFYCGDPTKLSADFKREIIKKFSEKYTNHKYIDVYLDNQVISRLNDETLTREIINHLMSDAQGVKPVLLQIVINAKLKDTAEAVLHCFTSPLTTSTVKTLAVQALKSIDNDEYLRKLSELSNSKKITDFHTSVALYTTLFPKFWDVETFIANFERMPSPGWHQLGHSHYLINLLESSFKNKLDRVSKIKILEKFTNLFEKALKNISDEENNSYKFICLAKPIALLLKVLLTNEELSECEVQIIAKSIWLLTDQRIPQEEISSEERNHDAASKAHPRVRQAAFWMAVAHELDKSTPSQELHSFAFCFYWPLGFNMYPADLKWILEDISQRDSAKERKIAVYLIWRNIDKKSKSIKFIKKSASFNNDTQILIDNLIAENRKILVNKLHNFFKNYRITYIHLRWKWLKIKKIWLDLMDFLKLYLRIKTISEGKAIGELFHLVHFALKSSGSSSNWTPSSWDGVLDKYGSSLTKAAKKGCQIFWRKYDPPYKETFNGTVIGLAGLALELKNENAFSNLSKEEIALASRYAMHEMNNPPVWFDQLSYLYPENVSKVLLHCIEEEWNLPAEPPPFIKYMRWAAESGPSLGKLIAPQVEKLLKESYALDVDRLKFSIEVVKKFSTWNLDQWADLALQHIKYLSVTSPQYICWVIVWLQVKADTAINYLELNEDIQINLPQIIEQICADFEYEHLNSFPRFEKPSFKEINNFPRFIELIYKSMPLTVYDDYSGEVTPYKRAQHYKSRILSDLAQHPSYESLDALKNLIENPVMHLYKDQLILLIESAKSRVADGHPWTPNAVVRLALENEIIPKTNEELYSLILRRLAAVKHDVEVADISLRQAVRKNDLESKVRTFLAGELQRRSKNLYAVNQESLIDRDERPDIRIQCSSIQNPISIEIKMADKDWTLQQLLDMLETQLVGQYMRDHGSTRGIYLIGYAGNKKQWENKQTGEKIKFSNLIELLEEKAQNLKCKYSKIDQLDVISIDFEEKSHLKHFAKRGIST